jgi:hypothetical protein
MIRVKILFVFISLIFIISCIKKPVGLESLSYNPYDSEYKGERWFEEVGSYKVRDSFYNNSTFQWVYTYWHYSEYSVKKELFDNIDNDTYLLVNIDSTIVGSDADMYTFFDDVFTISKSISLSEYNSGGSHHYYIKIAVGNLPIPQSSWEPAFNTEYGSQFDIVSSY